MNFNSVWACLPVRGEDNDRCRLHFYGNFISNHTEPAASRVAGISMKSGSPIPRTYTGILVVLLFPEYSGVMTAEGKVNLENG
ncbi:hypothetical protein N7468_000622 [Penicillium chermesinum]|uniref:Uncharacterized protein n=1 Tax=Penicillium chermesinum TaxID=63820 RepID=A0A9W9U0L2_9EURO|nr:uncharacterized protein N7468_000622 [Penicillium chermesinum]KAJ5249171.1 hypothetical protein N7468_000622 [Penicillium chermesinum]